MGSRKELLALQSLPLDIKVEKSKARIREWYDHWDGLVYVAFSGGKDSTVLKHLVDSIYSDVPAVYINTGLDLPEVRSFALRQKNAVRIDPRLRFAEIVRNYGFPVVSKEQAQYIYEFRRSKSESFKRYRWDGVGARKSGKIAERWKFLVNAPFPVSHMCCHYLKKEPAVRYEREKERHPYVGLLAEESPLRQYRWIREGCNAFQAKRPTSAPLSFWTEQDILRYIRENGIEISSAYGRIEADSSGRLFCTGRSRTGCALCAFGAHLEPCPNRFQQLAITNPALWRYGMEKLGMAAVLDYLGIPWKPIEITKRNEE